MMTPAPSLRLHNKLLSNTMPTEQKRAYLLEYIPAGDLAWTALQISLRTGQVFFRQCRIFYFP